MPSAHPRGSYTNSPLSGMSAQASKALINPNSTKLTLKWTDPDNTEHPHHTIADIPKPMFLKFSTTAAKHYSAINWRTTATADDGPEPNNTYDLGPQPHLDPAAVCYLLSQMHRACSLSSPRTTLAPYPEANVLRHLKCLIAVKALGVRAAEFAWRGALLDAVRAVNVTAAEFELLHRAFGEAGEPLLLRHALNCVAYAERCDELVVLGRERGGGVHPETERINRYVYGSAGRNRGLAVMKKAVERDVERKLVERAQRGRSRAEEVRRRSHEWNEEQKRKRIEFQQRRARRERKLEQARAGERALEEDEVRRLALRPGPATANVSTRLR